MILYSRWEQGCKPIHIENKTYSIDGRNFRSWKSALIHLGGSSYIPPSRYFRRKVSLDSLDLRDEISREVNNNYKTTVEGLTFFLRKKRGIDFNETLPDIRKLIYSGFSRKISGYEVEDIVQEVLQGLIIRNNGTCPYDPAKSSFGSYVHMVASCVISNYHQKNKKHTSWEEGEVQRTDTDPDPFFEGSLKDFILSKGDDNWATLFQLILEGQKTFDIAERLGYSVNKVSKLTRKVKELSAEWAKQQGMLHMVPTKFIKE